MTGFAANPLDSFKVGQLPKLNVVGSIPIARSNFYRFAPHLFAIHR
jgi:hypothetical protein